MNPDNRNQAKEQVYGDFRQLIARRKKTRTQRARSPIRLLLAVRLISGVELLESPSVSLLAGCLCLFVAGLSLFVILKPTQADVSVDAAAPNPSEPVLPQPASNVQVNEQTESSRSETNEGFIIRVGSFRNPSNARRVAESLQQKSLDVRTDVLADGLHVVTLGPFLHKSAAEDAARSVQETVGLVPQVLRRNFQ